MKVWCVVMMVGVVMRVMTLVAGATTTTRRYKKVLLQPSGEPSVHKADVSRIQCGAICSSRDCMAFSMTRSDTSLVCSVYQQVDSVSEMLRDDPRYQVYTTKENDDTLRALITPPASDTTTSGTPSSDTSTTATTASDASTTATTTSDASTTATTASDPFLSVNSKTDILATGTRVLNTAI